MKKMLPFVACFIVYLVGATMPLLEIDEAQYAEISKIMFQSGEYLKVYDLGGDYLDKPPLLFWTANLFFHLFGVSTFTFRLGPLLFSLLGIYSLYRFSKIYYSERIAYIAALIWASSIALIVMNRDVRTDNMLSAAIIFTIWQLAAFQTSGRLKYIVGAGIGLGLSLLAKGPIGLIVPAAAFTTDFVMRRDWRSFFRWQWILVLFVAALLLLPMCVGLYKQYGNYGLYFYFWKQSFGRITGENEWNNGVYIWFQAQNFLWGFQPWVIFFVVGFYKSIRKMFLDKFKIHNLSLTKEAISLGGFFLPFMAVSTSKYQLPHYSYCVFPLAALLTGIAIEEITTKNVNFSTNNQQPSTNKLDGWLITQTFFSILLIFVTAYLSLYCFPSHEWYWYLLLGLGSVFSVYTLFWKTRINRILGVSVSAVLLAGLLLNGQIFPEIYKYQAGNEIAFDVNTMNLPITKEQPFVVYTREHGDGRELLAHGTDFYLHKPFKFYVDEKVIGEVKEGTSRYFYIDEAALGEVRKFGWAIEIMKEYPNFHVSTLTGRFIDPQKRAKTIQKVFLAKITRP
jgi:4-amino-4-deoxy-L-arabinose transferase-like glycosyltransferase